MTEYTPILEALERISEIAGRPIFGTSSQTKANRFTAINTLAKEALAVARATTAQSSKGE